MAALVAVYIIVSFAALKLWSSIDSIQSLKTKSSPMRNSENIVIPDSPVHKQSGMSVLEGTPVGFTDNHVLVERYSWRRGADGANSAIHVHQWYVPLIQGVFRKGRTCANAGSSSRVGHNCAKSAWFRTIDTNHINPSSLFSVKVVNSGGQSFLRLRERGLPRFFSPLRLKLQFGCGILNSAVNSGSTPRKTIGGTTNAVCRADDAVYLMRTASVVKTRLYGLSKSACCDDYGQDQHHSLAVWNSIPKVMYVASSALMGILLLSVGFAMLVYYDLAPNTQRSVAWGLGLTWGGINLIVVSVSIFHV